ncbi:hypothetical protein [Paenibacillus sp. 23TSA30-6]|nr:hypothetical protein [Paenibacillus sp. 23TSA30-6]
MEKNQPKMYIENGVGGMMLYKRSGGDGSTIRLRSGTIGNF